ncbi:phosphonate C-P lyase system protein PhnH [Aquibacillus koreensis]|uniref:Phosphonate C-P lyase system protein PhnH n=1 Tax=Aquibacillus koreensis TaxID=279446 RepID=A0A9X3WMH2_9BACI|nr:phosphonate C-P lyase system protein PhnH [Aquibacillus koreensis]MCT2538150.1 phosphonate C-P lyase system protein PhnH [Aquibacillus koreensis]MDC3420906.1 phosphonate C-P lyase system protein PhnH [Aquibacillus koreensis]
MIYSNKAFPIYSKAPYNVNGMEVVKVSNQFQPYLTIDILQKLGMPKSIASVALHLLDSKTTFAYLNQHGLEISQFLEWKTKAKQQKVNDAEFLFVPGDTKEEQINHLVKEVFHQTKENADKHVTIVIDVEKVGHTCDEGGLRLFLTNQKDKSRLLFDVKGLSFGWIAERQLINSQCEYGMTLLLIGRDGECMCIPYYVKVEVECF